MRYRTTLVFCLAVSFATGPAWSYCRMASAGGKCETPGGAGASSGSITFKSAPNAKPPLEEGTPLPADARLLLNPDYYGLPSVDGQWRYYIVNDQLYKVDSNTLTVLERIRVGNRQLW